MRASYAITTREKFVKDHPEYGYGSCSKSPNNGRSCTRRLLDNIRERDFPHLLQHDQDGLSNLVGGLGRRQLVYLDHAGATLYSATQVREAMAGLLGAVSGNPHSQVNSSIFYFSVLNNKQSINFYLSVYI